MADQATLVSPSGVRYRPHGQKLTGTRRFKPSVHRWIQTLLPHEIASAFFCLPSIRLSTHSCVFLAVGLKRIRVLWKYGQLY